MEKVKLQYITNNLDNRRIPLNSIQRSAKTKIGLYPYVGANNIQGYIDEYIFDEKILCIAEDGGSWGKDEKCAVIINEKCWVNNHAHVLTAKDNLVLEYLMYYLNYSDLSLYINGATRGKLTQKALNNLEIPLPNLATQQRIAAILDQADAIIQNNRAIVQKYDALTQSLFLDMFGDPVKNEKRWEVVNFEQVLSLKRGYDLPVQERNENGNIPVFGSNGILGFHNISKRNEPCLVTGRSGSIGFVHKVDVPCWPLNTTLYSYLTNNNNIVYLEYLLRNFKIERFSHGAGVPTLDRKLVHKENIINVNITLQNQFAERVAMIEAQKEQAQLELAKSEELFQSLLQRAFNGELN